VSRRFLVQRPASLSQTGKLDGAALRFNSFFFCFFRCDAPEAGLNGASTVS